MRIKTETYFATFVQFLKSHGLFLLILILAAIVWSYVFSLATVDFLSGPAQPYRSVWNGSGDFDFFGFTIPLDFEGYLDYDYYYYSWGQQFVSGISPYTDAFNSIDINGTIYVTPYFFPPLYVYMCALGVILPVDPFGIGYLISLFGFLTAIPIYGISNYLSRNRRVGAVAAATYLFNPLVLYYTTFVWLNPAPFVFFAMLSFYLLMRGHRLAGTLAMATSALFKQTAFFLALPLLAYLLRKPPVEDPPETEEGKRPAGDELDIVGFIKTAIYVLIYVAAISLPYLTNIGNYFFYIFQRPGGLLYSDVTVLPDVAEPISFAVPFILFNFIIQNVNTSLGIALPLIPEIIVQGVNLGSYYSVFLILTMIPLLLFMLLNVKDDNNMRRYWGRMMFLTLLLMLSLHLFSPRGIYKYYCVALIPFLSILPISAMITQKSRKINLSIFMVLNPLICSIIILVPSRYVYLVFLLLIMLGYIAHKQFSLIYQGVNIQLKRIYRRIRWRSVGISEDALSEETASDPTPYS